MPCFGKPPPAPEPQVDVEAKLKELEDKLNKKIDEIQTSLTTKFSVDIENLKVEFHDKVTLSDDALKAHAERHTQSLHDLRKEMDSRIEASQQQMQSVRESTGSEAQQVRMELVAQIDSHKVSVEEAHEGIKKSAADAAEAAAVAHAAAKQAAEDVKGCHGVLETHVAELRSEIQAAHALTPPVAKRCEELQDGLDKITSQHLLSTGGFERSIKEMEQQIQTTRTGLENGIADCLERMAVGETSTRQHIEEVRSTVVENAERISETNSLSENVYCRTLHWTCRRFHRRLSASLQKEAAVDNPGVLSPEFSLCSLPPMQVEVCLAVQTAAAEGAPAPPLPVPGSCCVRVWAQPSIEMTFRITLGDGPTAMSRRFDHSFQVPEGEDVPPGSGRVAFEIRNYCQLDQVWVRSSDSLQVTFELLEFTTRPVAQLLILPDLDTIEEKSQGSQAPTEAPPEGDAPEEGEEDAPPEDDMFFTRSGTAELLLHERLQKDLVSIRNRSVRRVEWRVEGCSRLLDFCKVGEAVDSPVFSAGGLERLQFHFYPKGCEPVGGAISPCSLFISGPDKGASVRGVLWVGTNGRQFEHRFGKRGDMGGRPRFCALEQLLDPADWVVLALDIAEVEQDLPEHNQALVLREARSAPVFEPVSPMNPSRNHVTSVAEQTGAKATLKVKREDHTKMEELVKSVSLPMLNAKMMSTMSSQGPKSRRSIDF